MKRWVDCRCDSRSVPLFFCAATGVAADIAMPSSAMNVAADVTGDRLLRTHTSQNVLVFL
jgi:hypothetical protein